MSNKKIINILLADDDDDDRFFFEKALKKLSIQTKLVSVDDGEKLIDYLFKIKEVLPDILFLDINMPRKNGYECLMEIKSNDKISSLPVVMYSTSLKNTMADMLYNEGAHYYLRKGSYSDLEKYLQLIITMLEEKKFQRPLRDQFTLNEMQVI